MLQSRVDIGKAVLDQCDARQLAAQRLRIWSRSARKEFLGVVAARRPGPVQVLALSFLLLIGFTLVAEAFEVHVSKGYVYFAMAFSLAVEALNIRMRTARRRAEGKADPEPVKLRKDVPGQ